MRTSPIILALALAALSPAALQAQQGGRWRFHRGMGAESWARMDAVAVVRVTGAPSIPENPNDTRRSWPVVLLATYAGGPPVSRVKLHGGKNGPDGWFEAPGVYLVVGAMPKDGKDAPLFDDQDTTRLDPAPDGQARVYWALPFRGSPPRAGGTKEEFFGRAVLAALEGDPQVYKEGLEEFFQGVDRSVLGLTELADPAKRGRWWEYGYRPNDFVRELLAWSGAHGPAERLFAAYAASSLKVNGAMPLVARRKWEYAALDTEPPTPYLYSDYGGVNEVSTELVPPEWRAAMLAEWLTPEEWLGRLLALKSPRMQHWMLNCYFLGSLDHDQQRRLSALLSSPLVEVRYELCLYFWLSLQEPDPGLEPKRRSEGLRNDQPDDFPRLDEHVAYWKAYFR